MTSIAEGVVSLDEYRKVMEGSDKGFVKIGLDDCFKFISETALYKDAWKMQEKMFDQVLPASKLMVKVLVDYESGRAVPLLVTGGKEYSFTSTAFGQLCEKSGMGMTSYMKKCIANNLPELVPQNVNTWLEAQGERPLLVRFCGPQVIAFLSDRYGIFDHGEALDCLRAAIGGGNNYRVESYSLSVDNMTVKIVDTEQVLLKDVSGGRDKAMAGLVFRNGQTGGSVASVEFMVYTLACTNGLVIAQDRGMVYRRRHINIERETFTEQIAATVAQFPEYVLSAREDMEKARQVRVSAELQTRLKQQIKRDLSVGDETIDEIFEVMEKQWDPNAWGMAGAITEVAQRFSAERQYQFEKYAGELLRQLAA